MSTRLARPAVILSVLSIGLLGGCAGSGDQAEPAYATLYVEGGEQAQPATPPVNATASEGAASIKRLSERIEMFSITRDMLIQRHGVTALDEASDPDLRRLYALGGVEGKEAERERRELTSRVSDLAQTRARIADLNAEIAACARLRAERFAAGE